MLSIFSCVCWPSVSLLWRNVCLGLWPIFLIGLLVFFDIKLYELFVYSRNKSLVYHIICKYFLPVHKNGRLILCRFICKYFLPFWGLSFCLVMVSFTVQKLLSLIRSHLFIFVFISITLGDISKKILLWFMSKSVCSACVFL